MKTRPCRSCGAPIKNRSVNVPGTIFCSKSCWDASHQVPSSALVLCVETGEVKSLTDWGKIYANRTWKGPTAANASVTIAKGIRVGRKTYGKTFVRVASQQVGETA